MSLAKIATVCGLMSLLPSLVFAQTYQCPTAAQVRQFRFTQCQFEPTSMPAINCYQPLNAAWGVRVATYIQQNWIDNSPDMVVAANQVLTQATVAGIANRGTAAFPGDVSATCFYQISNAPYQASIEAYLRDTQLKCQLEGQGFNCQ